MTARRNKININTIYAILIGVVFIVIFIGVLASLGVSQSMMYIIGYICLLAVGGIFAIRYIIRLDTKKHDTAASEKYQERPATFKSNLHDIYPPVLGIDLGTTTSLVATIYKNEVHIIKNKHGEYSEPSLVTIDKKGIISVGSDAKASLENLDSISYSIGSIKRQIGRFGGTVIINGKKFYPQIISALILAHLKKQAEQALNVKFEEAVISVPANFNTVQREATREAAQLAGLKVLRITNEAVAAAVCYGCHPSVPGEEKIIVVDLGGGTLDVTIVQIGWDDVHKCATFEVISTRGDSSLGGDDFTEKLYGYIRDQIKYTFAIYPANTYINRQRLIDVAENVKKTLSLLELALVSIPYLQMENGTYKTIGLTILRKDFEEIIQDLINRMVECINKSFDYTHLSAKNIDKVIVVGGATRMPIVMRQIEKLFGNKICGKKFADIDTAVVEGTTMIGGIIKGGAQDVLVLDVLPKSIGIELEGGACDILIEKNTTIPTRKSKTFTTTKDNQNSINVSLYEGESRKIVNNDFLLSFSLGNILPAAKGVPKIEVSIDVDQNCMVNIEAKDLGSGVRKSEKINIYSTLRQDEKEKIANNIKDWVEFNKMFNL